MPDSRQDGTQSNAGTAQAIRDETPGFVFQPPQQTLGEALGCRPVPPPLCEDIQHDAVLVDCPPEIVQLAVDTSRKLRLNTWSSQTAWLMISAGNR